MNLTPPIISIGQTVLDTVLHHQTNHYSFSESRKLPKKFTIGGPPAFCLITGLRISQLFPWAMPPIVYAYSCQKAIDLLRSYSGINPLLKTLRIRDACPEFRLEYLKNSSERRIYLRNPPQLFDPTEFPWKFTIPPTVVIGSVYHEFSSEKIFSFLRKNTGFIAFDPQGCFRFLTPEGRIILQKWFEPEILRHVDCLKISEIEVMHLGKGDNLLQSTQQILETSTRIVLLTRGSRGAVLGFRSLDTGNLNFYSIPAYKTGMVRDETGAGDVFLYSFVAHYVSHQNELDAIAFGSSISSLLIERKGVTGNFSKEIILDRQEYIRRRVRPLSVS
ncbi:MAG: carbohydrate kinase family protein [Candidatus Heimdallarchaeota archaeon]